MEQAEDQNLREGTHLADRGRVAVEKRAASMGTGIFDVAAVQIDAGVLASEQVGKGARAATEIERGCIGTQLRTNVPTNLPESVFEDGPARHEQGRILRNARRQILHAGGL
jgi:hypothetical protein